MIARDLINKRLKTLIIVQRLSYLLGIPGGIALAAIGEEMNVQYLCIIGAIVACVSISAGLWAALVRECGVECPKCRQPIAKLAMFNLSSLGSTISNETKHCPFCSFDLDTDVNGQPGVRCDAEESTHQH